ncbi:glycosyltransferase [Nesterenkonia populi]|uniref:glycosyltransferase n=1 Tax=Nesterenkonia populi TaxID=1591087 RepID=UPI0011BF3E30|nr:glycosyltransferase [Nesterenkonia populi]
MLFVGHTRFSVYSFESAGFAATRQEADEDAYRNWLYADDRLRPRAKIFIEESLPQIAQAAGGHHNVVHVVCYSPGLPEIYKDELRKAAETYPFLRLHETSEQVGGFAPPLGALREATGWKADSRQRIGIYRLDDDDLVATDYFDRMASYARRAEPGWKISLGLGYTALRSEGEYYFPRLDHQAMASVGLMSIVDLDEQGELQGLVSRPHHLSDTGNPVILDSTIPGFFRTRHVGQDNIIDKWQGKDFLATAVAQIRDWPEASAEEVLSRFPAMAGRLNESLSKAEQGIELLREPIKVGSATVGFHTPYREGSVIALDLDGEVTREQFSVRYKLHNQDGSRVDKDEIKDFFASQRIKHNNYGFHQAVSHNEDGPVKHLIVRCPEGVELAGFDLFTKTDEEAVKVNQVTVYPALSPAAD